MCQKQYDLTYEDMNPTLLFSCILKRTETEENYHSHDFIEIVIILDGEGCLLIDGESYTARTGDIFILNPGTYHRSIRTDSPVCTTECYVSFTDITFRDCKKGCFPLFQDGRIVHAMSSKLKQHIFQLCRSISVETNSWQPGRDFMLKAYLIQIICLVIRSQQETPAVLQPEGYIFHSPNKQYVVRQITDYMKLHYKEKISLDQIAANMYLSTFYISKIFKSETGDTPINYLIQLRMEKAKELLRDTSKATIQEIADEVGYSDTYHFSKLFKKYCGVSPSRYRSENFGG